VAIWIRASRLFIIVDACKKEEQNVYLRDKKSTPNVGIIRIETARILDKVSGEKS
jgi:hypothetical protein